MKKYAFVAILLNIWIVSLENVTFLSPIKEDLLQTFQPYWIEICTLIAIIGPISIHNVSKEILVPGGDILTNLVLFKLVKERFEKRAVKVKVTLKYFFPDTFQLKSKQTPPFLVTNFSLPHKGLRNHWKEYLRFRFIFGLYFQKQLFSDISLYDNSLKVVFLVSSIGAEK